MHDSYEVVFYIFVMLLMAWAVACAIFDTKK